MNVYSLRAKDQPTVSTPVTWDEVANGSEEKKRKASRLPLRKVVLQRVEKMGDLFEPVETLKQKLPKKWNL